MKQKAFIKLWAAICGLILSTSLAFAQGTAFTYQGRLNDGANPANGSYDVTFALFDAAVAGTKEGSTLTNAAVAVSNGLFTVTLDFGSQFPNANRWLEIGVRTNGGGAFATLAPRQQLTPTPYAITAGQLAPGTGLLGVYSGAVILNNASNNFSGTFVGNGMNVSNVNAANLGGLSAGQFWQISGNAGTIPGVSFVGTTDNQALQLKVNNTVALEIAPAPTVPNIVGGQAGVKPAVIRTNVSGAVVAGGNAPSAGVNGYGFGDYHAVYDNDGTIGGGFGNKVGSDDGDSTDAAFATVAGGVFNQAANYGAIVAGGDSNLAGGQRAAVLGGYDNQALGPISTVGGGLQNTIQTNASDSAIAGGQQNVIGDSYSFIGGGSSNSIQPGAFSAISGGSQNTASNNYVSIAGGQNNIGGGIAASVGGGAQNSVAGNFSTIGGGLANSCSGGGAYATIPGGQDNRATGEFSMAAGRAAQALYQGDFVWSDSQGSGFASTTNDEFSVRARGGVRFCGTGNTNLVIISPIGQLTAFGTSGNGVEGHSTNSASSGVYGQSDGQGYGVSGRSSGTGTAVFGDNNNASGWAGYFNGNVRVTGTINPSSDRNVKQDFHALDTQEVLAKVVALPIQSWAYKADAGRRHIGPVAQEFHAAFGLNGDDDKSIATVDADGVALAAIQGLNQKVAEKDAEIQQLQRSVAELKELVSQLAQTRSR